MKDKRYCGGFFLEKEKPVYFEGELLVRGKIQKLVLEYKAYVDCYNNSIENCEHYLTIAKILKKNSAIQSYQKEIDKYKAIKQRVVRVIKDLEGVLGEGE